MEKVKVPSLKREVLISDKIRVCVHPKIQDNVEKAHSQVFK